ncbi:hypothetical protein MW887_003833 [Aspergillus wentii]|nr:hypothetical protein MW887_003833 [Aspergillus wentii]
MAFSFGASNPAGGNAPAELGPELPDVFTDDVGFKGVSSDSNVRLLRTPWPADALPAPTCALLAVAPSKGIVVGAGPDSLSISSSEAVRKAISAPSGEDKVKTKPFEPQATISLSARPTHVVFCSGDSALVLATENGAQLSVYDTATLLQGNAQPALSVPTNGASFRAIVPNPAPSTEAHSSFVALVTTGGELLIADLKGGNLISGPNGNVLKSGVSCVSWSNKGKQLVAGLADGTGYQMTPEGVQKDAIPRPPDLEDNCHVSSISWLENDVFLMVYTPNAEEDDMGQNPPSSYYIISRRKQAPFLIQKLPELCAPWGLRRTPAYQFMARLRDYKPHLKDVLIVSSTASTDVGLITRSDQPLASDDAAKGTVGLFTMTEVNDDTKKASPPLTDSGDETSVIGLGLDLSSTEIVVAPIQGEDIAESSTPLPNLLLLNHDGILSSWWFIYSESIRQKLPYQGLASLNQQPQQPQAPAPAPALQAPAQPAFAQSGFGASAASSGPSPFGKPSTAAPAFGSPSTFGGSQKPSFGTPSFGAPSFGSPSQIGSGFGAPSAPGQAGPQFGKSGFGSMGTSSFGQPSTPAKPLGSLPFSTPGATSGGGFGSFAGGGGSGFASFASAKPAGESPFGKPATANPFGKPSGASIFGGQTDQNTAFASPKTDQQKPAFGLGSNGFVLGSAFKGDGSAANDGPKPEKPSGLFSMGESLDDMVSTPSKPSPPTESMDDMDDEPVAPQPAQPPAKESAPTPAPVPSLFGQPSKPAAPSGPTPSLFGALAKPAEAAPSGPTPSPFGSLAKPAEAAPTAPISKPFSLFGNAGARKQVTSPLSPPSEKTSVPSSTPKKEQPTDVENTPKIQPEEAPLPPDPTTKASYGPGDTSASSNVSKSSVDDAPLPPDFVTKPKPVSKDVGEPPLPPDFVTKPKETKEPAVKAEEAPLPPDPTEISTTKPAETPGPVPDDGSDVESEQDGDEEEDEHADDEEPAEEGDGDDAEESGFTDSGEDITHDISHTEEEAEASPESSFGKPFGTSAVGGLFGKIPKPAQNEQPRQLFGEIGKPIFPPGGRFNHEPPRSPSPVRDGAQKGRLRPDNFRSASAPQGPGNTLAARKAALTETALRESQLKPRPAEINREEQARLHAQAQREEEEALSLSDDDEDERLRADLARPLEPVPTLDPFLPHQDYTGQTSKPGIPGQIERLYRDINSMVDTLGINARSLSSFLLYQQSSDDSNSGKWVETLQGDHPAGVLDEKLLLREIEKLDDAVVVLAGSLQQQRVQGVEEKLDQCRELLGKDILTLRSQCASIQKTLDAHTDAAAILSAPLSAEQANLQQDLRSASTDIQARLADLEQGVSLLRAKIADVPRPDSSTNGPRPPMKRPTVEAVASTIATMMNMAESKSSDIDVLEVQLKKLGIDTTASPASREGSPFATPKKSLAKFPTTPGSRGSVDVPVSAYHTPESASRGINFRSSISGSARVSRLRSVEGVGDLVTKEDSQRWKAKTQRRQHLVGNLKKAIGEKKSKVRGADDL